jgi:hypothetical protein
MGKAQKYRLREMALEELKEARNER